MAHADDIKAIRDYVVTQVEAAWPGLEINRENPETLDDAPNALIRLDNVEYPEGHPRRTITQDVSVLTFVIGGRWDTDQTSNDLIEKGTAIRTALLSTVNPASKGFSPHVGSVRFNVQDDLTGLWTMVVVYTVYLMAARS
jgi:hypothetical protein